MELGLGTGLPVGPSKLPPVLAGRGEPAGPVHFTSLLFLHPTLPLGLFQLQLGRFSGWDVPFLKEPLVRPESAVRRGKDVHKPWLQVVELNGEPREAVVKLVILRKRSRTPDAPGGRSHSAVKPFAPFPCNNKKRIASYKKSSSQGSIVV